MQTTSIRYIFQSLEGTTDVRTDTATARNRGEIITFLQSSTFRMNPESRYPQISGRIGIALILRTQIRPRQFIHTASNFSLQELYITNAITTNHAIAANRLMYIIAMPPFITGSFESLVPTIAMTNPTTNSKNINIKGINHNHLDFIILIYKVSKETSHFHVLKNYLYYAAFLQPLPNTAKIA